MVSVSCTFLCFVFVHIDRIQRTELVRVFAARIQGVGISFERFVNWSLLDELSIFPFALFHVTVGVEEASLSISLVFLPVANVIGSIVPHESTMAVSLVVTVHSFVEVARLEHVPSRTCDNIWISLVKQAPQVLVVLASSKVL